jgi:hypothetical protein
LLFWAVPSFGLGLGFRLGLWSRPGRRLTPLEVDFQHRVRIDGFERP